MKNPVLFFLLLAAMSFGLFIAYLAWFQPGELTKRRKRGKSRYKNLIPLIPDTVIEAFLLPEGIAFWWGRIISVVFVILCLILMWVAAFGSPIELP